MSYTICTFEDVLLDWAIAEVLSPAAWKEYYNSVGETFRERVATTQREHLSAADRALLLEAVRYVREPLIVDECGITESWRFWWSSISPTAMSGYSILGAYRDCYGDISLGEFATAVRDHPLEAERHARESVLAMIALADRGVQFNGRPIAVKRPDSAAPLLIEGYKRSIAALLGGVRSIEVYFCRP